MSDRPVPSPGDSEMVRRFDGLPLTTDADHPDLGYFISEPLPYYPQPKPRLLTRLAVLTVFRRDRCRRRWCSWPATERGYVCDRHAPVVEVAVDG